MSNNLNNVLLLRAIFNRDKLFKLITTLNFQFDYRFNSGVKIFFGWYYDIVINIHIGFANVMHNLYHQQVMIL